MNVCIATIRNSKNTILKYRLYNHDKKHMVDVHARSIGNRIQAAGIRNLALSNTGVVCLEGNIDDYPIIIANTNQVDNAGSPVVISVNNAKAILCNYDGRAVEAPLELIKQKIHKFANAELSQTGDIVIKSTGNEVISNIEQSKPQEEVTTAKEQKPEQSTAIKQVSSGKSLFDAVMRAEDTQLNIRSFTAQDYKESMELSNRVFMSPTSLVNDIYSRGRSVSVEDKSAYSFNIVRSGDRVELVKYIGEGYKGLVVIPDGVTHIDKSSFERCEAEEIQMPDTVIYLGDGAFFGSKTVKMRLSRKVTAIPFMCFAESEIQDIDLSNITSIDNMAFKGSKITEVHIKAPLEQIGFEAFFNCQSLAIFEHNKTVKKIRHHAFAKCINLANFDFSSVTTLEQYAFNSTAIKKAVLNGEIKYLQTGTITGSIEEIELLDGFYKISADAVSNVYNKHIVWTMPNSVTNIEGGVFKKQDTVMCYRKSVAASSAIMADANVVYLDDLKGGEMPKVFARAMMINKDINELLKETITKILSQEDNADIKYEVDESKALRLDIPESIHDLIGAEILPHTRPATDEDIEAEGVKFKCILEHLYKVAPADISPFSSTALTLKDTFNVAEPVKNDVLYSDELSRVVRVKYVDNKFSSVNSSFIIATTLGTLRYICMDNRYTDIMCEDKEVLDLKKLLDVLREGDTIGLDCILSGAKYADICGESQKEIIVTKGRNKIKQKLQMNIYQALRYGSITLRLDNNNIALLLPGNNTIIKCASLGKTVWLNEKEDTYKSLQATIEAIQPLDTNNIIDYEATHKTSNRGELLQRFMQMPSGEYSSYIERYSHIYPSEQSMYKKAGGYAERHNMHKIGDVDITFLNMVFETELFESRDSAWLQNSIGKTIVEDAKFKFVASDGTLIRQYRNVKRIALRNKLMVGGDRKLYVFDIIGKYGMREGVYISLYDIETLVNMCLGTRTSTGKEIFKNRKEYDIVDYDDVIEISELCRGTEINTGILQFGYVLAVYKPNGRFYIGLKKKNKKMNQFVPIIQVGELDVALEFIENSNKYGLKDKSMHYLYSGTMQTIEDIAGQHVFRRIGANAASHAALLRAREMCIDGISDIVEYNKLGIQEVLKRCLGYTPADIPEETYDNTVDSAVEAMAEIDAEVDKMFSDLDEDESMNIEDKQSLDIGIDLDDIDDDDFGDI